jgi:hypothetical protein
MIGYIYWDRELITQGLVSQSARMQGRPIKIEHVDKVKKYIKTLIPKIEHQKI